MGKDLADRFPEAGEVFEMVDEALGTSLSTLMWEGPEHELTQTYNAQPAILAHTLATYAVVRHVLDPVVAAGHSLGEYSAYTAAGSLRLVDAARLVRRRGALMLEAGDERPGTMTAIVGLEAGRVEDVCAASSGNGRVAVAANINAPDQTVISGDPDAVERAGIRCKEAGAKRVLPLKVSGAFHSPLMEPARVGLSAELEVTSFANPAFPVIANATAELISDAETARRRLAEQLTSPVRWAASMLRAEQESGAPVRYVELGPGRVLCGLLRRIVPAAESVSLSSSSDIDGFLEEAG